MKPIHKVDGQLCYPIQIGLRAFIRGKQDILTSPVVDVLQRTEEKIVFETQNTVYELKQAA